MNRIHTIEIAGLHGKLNYTVPLNIEKRMSVLWGKNGCGKTAVLDFLCDYEYRIKTRNKFDKFFIVYKSNLSESANTFIVDNRVEFNGTMDWVNFNFERSFDGNADFFNAMLFDRNLILDYLSKYIENMDHVIQRKSNDHFYVKNPSGGTKKIINIMMSLCYNWKSPSVLIFDNLGDGLHVDWQRRLLSDMQEIAAMKNLDIIAATHSPILIGKHWDVAVELK